MSTLLARRMTRSLISALFALSALLAPAHAYAAEHPATAAMEEVRGREIQKDVIRNRFFLKENRFEVAISAGYVPNNAFVTIVLGGAFLAYHFNESLAVEGALLYAPNTSNAGVKNLTETLVDIAYDENADSTFQQPLDRLQLGAIFDARWAPVYGKINLIGEGVLNFDVYGTAGVGLLLITKDQATPTAEFLAGEEGAAVVRLAENPPTEPNVAVNLGIGFNFFLSQSIALKLDARSELFVAKEPDYGYINEATGEPEELQNRLYNTFITTAGVSIFVPKMKARVYNF